MSTTSDFITGDRPHANERPEANAPARPRTSGRSLVPRGLARGTFSLPMRHALAEAVRRASVILSESSGKTADEIQAQLRPIVDVLPALSIYSTDDAVADGVNWTIPRRFIDVLRVEVLTTLAAHE